LVSHRKSVGRLRKKRGKPSKIKINRKIFGFTEIIVYLSLHQAYISMVQIKNEIQYKAACERINELLKVVNNDTPADDKNLLELDLISDLVADYEEEHYPTIF
jgi:hypothetical protein